jgi:16S rRNA G966 N2-methylase RsmD
VERNLVTCGFADRAEVVADRAERLLARWADRPVSERPGPAAAGRPSGPGRAEVGTSATTPPPPPTSSPQAAPQAAPRAGPPAGAAGGLAAGPERGRRFDVAFCDPPYAFDGWADLLAALPAGLAVIEARDEVALPGGWELVRGARYGTVWVGFAERR